MVSPWCLQITWLQIKRHDGLISQQCCGRRRDATAGKTVTLAGPKAWTVEEVIALCEKYADAEADVSNMSPQCNALQLSVYLGRQCCSLQVTVVSDRHCDI